MVEKDPSPGAPVPERILDEDKGKKVKKDSFEAIIPEFPEEDETIKSLLTSEHSAIKSLLTNPISYTIIELGIKLLRIVEHSIPEDRDKGRNIKTFLILLNSEHGLPVFEHLLEYGSYTYREIEIKLGVPKPTIHYITTKLIYLQLVEPKTVVLPFNPKTPGQRPIVWVLKGAPASFSVDCIKRYYGLVSPIRVEVEEKIISNVIRETLEYFKTKDRIGRRVPNQPEIGKYIKAKYPDVEGRQIPQIAQKIRQMLYKIVNRVHALPDQSRMEENLSMVLERIKPPITQLGPLYEILDTLQIVDPEERAAINAYFVKESAKQAGG